MEHWPVLGSNRKFIEISDKLLLKEFVQPNGCGFGALAIRRNYWPPTLMCLEQEKDSKRLAVWKWKEAHSHCLLTERGHPKTKCLSFCEQSRTSVFWSLKFFVDFFSALKKWTILCPGPKWRLVGLPPSPPCHCWGEMESGDFKVRRAVRGTRPAGFIVVKGRENRGFVIWPQKPGFPYFP